jgi:hypothetical protein
MGKTQKRPASTTTSAKLKKKEHCKKNCFKKKQQASNERKSAILGIKNLNTIREELRHRKSLPQFDNIPQVGTFPDPIEHSDWLILNHGTILITDAESLEPVFMVRFTPLSSLRQDPDTLATMQRLFQFHLTSIPLLNHIKINGGNRQAGGAGIIVGHGYRRGYDKGFKFGKYHARSNVQKDPKLFQQYLDMQEELKFVEGVYRDRFLDLSPTLFHILVTAAKETDIPNFAAPDIKSVINPFASNLFTSLNYASAPHVDGDFQDWVFGIFGTINCKNGLLVDKSDGYDGYGTYFCVIPYQVAVELDFCGVIEITWRGNRDEHMTTYGIISSNFGKIGSATQINNRLVSACIEL